MQTKEARHSCHAGQHMGPGWPITAIGTMSMDAKLVAQIASPLEGKKHLKILMEGVNLLYNGHERGTSK